jgi:hypothetical protein
MLSIIISKIDTSTDTQAQEQPNPTRSCYVLKCHSAEVTDKV